MTTQIKDLAHYKEVYDHSVNAPEEFWKKEAETFTWYQPFDSVCEWNF